MKSTFSKVDLRILNKDIENLEEALRAYEENPVILDIKAIVPSDSPWDGAIFNIGRLDPDSQTEVMFALHNDLERKKLKYKEMLQQELNELDDVTEKGV